MAVPKPRSETVPADMRSIYDPIIAVTDEFCRQHLNEEYAKLSRELAAALVRRQPSPLERGEPVVWACAIVYALGSINLLWYKPQEPHMTPADLCAAFGVKRRTAENKARSIREMFDMHGLDPDWCLPSVIPWNPAIWLIPVNGIPIYVSYLPREIQELVYRNGLIPYMPRELPEAERRTQIDLMHEWPSTRLVSNRGDRLDQDELEWLDRLQQILRQASARHELLSNAATVVSADGVQTGIGNLARIAPTLALETEKGLIAAVICGETRLSYKKIKKALGLENVSFADPDALLRRAGVRFRTVSLINPGLATIIDNRVIEGMYVYGDCGVPCFTLRIDPAGLIRVTNARVFDFTEPK